MFSSLRMRNKKIFSFKASERTIKLLPIGNSVPRIPDAFESKEVSG